MDELQKLRKLYELKRVYRRNSVEGRKESAAEHCWSCLILADYFLDKLALGLDRLKVYELLMYHDVVEIEAGDTPIADEEKRRNKQKEEFEALKKLGKVLPKTLGDKLAAQFTEFETGTSAEARFAKAVDRLDALVHELDYKDDWRGWSEPMLRKLFEKDIVKVPGLKEEFEALVSFAKQNSYLS